MSVLRPNTIGNEWSPAEANALNDVLRDTLSILNGGISITDQFRGLKVGVVWLASAAPVTIGPFPKAIKYVLCLGARLVSNRTASISGAAVTWTMVGANVSVTDVALTGGPYEIDLLCLEG